MAEPEPDEPVRPPPAPTWGDLLAAFAPDRRRLVALGAALLLVVGAGVAGYALLRTPPSPPVEQALPFAGGAEFGAAPASTAPTTSQPSTFVVHAAGAVAVPGLHEVASGARVADVLAAAGGPSPDADLDRVNLAAPVADGERVWFPRIGEPAPPVAVGATASGGGTTSAAPVGPLDLNTASAEELDELPGIGPAIAAAIVEHRERNGRFASVDDLLDVPGIGDAKLAQLRDLVRV